MAALGNFCSLLSAFSSIHFLDYETVGKGYKIIEIKNIISKKGCPHWTAFF
jgi:hypothetical protein